MDSPALPSLWTAAGAVSGVAAPPSARRDGEARRGEARQPQAVPVPVEGAPAPAARRAISVAAGSAPIHALNAAFFAQNYAQARWPGREPPANAAASVASYPSLTLLSGVVLSVGALDSGTAPARRLVDISV